MAKTIIDSALNSAIRRIVSTQSIDDADKEGLRILAGEAMQVYNRSRVFAWTWRFEGIIAGSVIVMSIVFAFLGQPVGAWVTPLTIAFIATVVFGILTFVFRSRYKARVSNLEAKISIRERREKGKTFPVVPFVCVVGPYMGSSRGVNVTIESQKGGISLPGYSSIGLSFIESNEGGSFTFHVRKALGNLSIEPNECAIVTVNAHGQSIAFEKQRIEVPESAFVVEEPVVAPAVESNGPKASVPTPVAPQPKPSKPVDLTPNELLEKYRIDTYETTLSIPSGKVSFFVMEKEVCDMLKPGDYPLTIDSFPRLKALDSDALGKNVSSVSLMTIDTERVYRIGWKIEGSVFAKGDVEFKIANPRLFINCVIEDDLMLKTDFEGEVLSLIKPSILKCLQTESSSDYDVIEKNLLKNLARSLNKLGLSVEFIGLNALSKEEAGDKQNCVNCGKSIPGDSVFCPYCGKKQEDNICSNCGAEIPEGALFCPKCGTRK